jgi:hypothetical protein
LHHHIVPAQFHSVGTILFRIDPIQYNASTKKERKMSRTTSAVSDHLHLRKKNDDSYCPGEAWGFLDLIPFSSHTHFRIFLEISSVRLPQLVCLQQPHQQNLQAMTLKHRQLS